MTPFETRRTPAATSSVLAGICVALLFTFPSVAWGQAAGDEWLPDSGLPEPPYFEKADMVYHGSGDSIYAFLGIGGTSGFWRYSLTEGSWESLAEQPWTADGGNALAYPGAGDLIYALRGWWTTDFWAYSISGDSWQELAPTPEPMKWSTDLVYAGIAGYLYARQGKYGTGFWRYSIDTDSWESMAAMPAPGGIGGALVYPGTGDFIYSVRGCSSGDSNSDFWRYSVSADSWESLADTPAAAGAEGGGALVSPEGGDFIYAYRGNLTKDFWRYSISTDSWEVMADTPRMVGRGSALVYPGSGDTLYAIRGLLSVAFWSYSISTNSWTGTDDLPPGTVDMGGALVYPGSGDYIYALQGYPPYCGTGEFWRYSLSEATWESLAVMPEIVEYGADLVYPGSGDFIYALRGFNTTDFWRYSISAGVWESRARTPEIVSAGGSLVYPGSGDYIYAFRGSSACGGAAYTKDFWRYSISTDSWESRAATPDFVGVGGDLVYPGSGDFIYAFEGLFRADFWRYSISSDSWESRAAAPATVSYGGSLAYPGSGDFIYALRGGSSWSESYADFWRYSISADSWESMADTPHPVGSGGALVYPGSGEYLFAFQGGHRDRFLQYRLPSATPTEPTDLLVEQTVAGPEPPIEDFWPEFQATYNDPDSGDIALKYQILVTHNGMPVWDSGDGGTPMEATLEGTPCPDIEYGGSPLIMGEQYVWCIKFWDEGDKEGPWSPVVDFTMAILEEPFPEPGSLSEPQPSPEAEPTGGGGGGGGSCSTSAVNAVSRESLTFVAIVLLVAIGALGPFGRKRRSALPR